MNPATIEDLLARLRSAPRPLQELHRAAAAAGSAWSSDQVALLLACLPGISESEGLWHLESSGSCDPIADALVALASTQPTPAMALVGRLPPGVVASAAALCDIARQHPELELLPGRRIRRR